MGRLDNYLPVMAMLLVQFIYAGIALGTRTVLLEGMSPRVFVVYRQAMATVVIAPIAYFSGYLSLPHWHLYVFLLTCLVYLFLFFDRRKSGSCSLTLRSFSLIFFASLIGFVFILKPYIYIGY